MWQKWGIADVAAVLVTIAVGVVLTETLAVVLAMTTTTNKQWRKNG